MLRMTFWKWQKQETVEGSLVAKGEAKSIWELSVFTQFSCKPQTVLKQSINDENKFMKYPLV